MGLDCSHDAWSGAYSAFHRWRSTVAKAAGLPPLDLMEGFYDTSRIAGNPFALANDIVTRQGATYAVIPERITSALPILWGSLKPDPLHELLYHSDCDGEIAADRCGLIADSLERLLPDIPDDGGGHIGANGGMAKVTERFIRGLRAAAAANEPLDFH